VAAPESYELNSTSSLSLAQSTVMDIPIPAKRLNIHVQDPGGNPVSNVSFRTPAPGPWNEGLTLGTLQARGESFYNSPAVVTDVSGNATLWLFPNGYVISALPPEGSPFATPYYGVNLTDDTYVTITLSTPVG
jgi:hypothetical protein